MGGRREEAVELPTEVEEGIAFGRLAELAGVARGARVALDLRFTHKYNDTE